MWCDGCDRAPGCGPYRYILAASCTQMLGAHLSSSATVLVTGKVTEKKTLFDSEGWAGRVRCLHLNLSAVL